MRIRALGIAMMLAAGLPVFAAERDAKADAVGHELIAAMGGHDAWERARQFQFEFVVEKEGKTVARFAHAWDRYTGDYRLSGTDKAGAPYTVYFNVNTKAGKVFVNNVAVEGEEKGKRLEGAYGRFINDTYWLLAPWKIFDPGVRLTYDAEKPSPGGGVCDVLKLSFDNVGLTPKDVYWLWIARDSRRMIQWQYVLGGVSEAPTTAEWTNWQKLGGILLSLDKPMSGEPISIRFEKVSVSPARDDSLFTTPAAP